MGRTPILWLVAVPIVIATLLPALARMRAQVLHDLGKVLDERKNIELYLRLLDTRRLRLLFSRRALASLREEGIHVYGTSIPQRKEGDRVWATAMEHS